MLCWRIFNLDAVSCEDSRDIQGMLVALVTLGALATVASSIALFVSCFSLCNQEHREVYTFYREVMGKSSQWEMKYNNLETVLFKYSVFSYLQYNTHLRWLELKQWYLEIAIKKRVY